MRSTLPEEAAVGSRTCCPTFLKLFGQKIIAGDTTFVNVHNMAITATEPTYRPSEVVLRCVSGPRLLYQCTIQEITDFYFSGENEEVSCGGRMSRGVG